MRFADAAQLAAVFQRDIVNGGLFVSTPEPARLQEMVAIDLHPPGPLGQETEPIRCRARVVHRVEPRPTSGMAGKNLLAGMGVELLDAASVVERLRAVVERLSRG